MGQTRLPRPRHLLFALVPLAVMFLVGEVAVRALWTAPEPDAAGIGMAAHPTRIWGLRPGTQDAFDATFTVSERGLRETANTGAPYTALTLGDSSIFGHGLDDADTLHASLRRSFGRSGLGVDVACGAIPGYSTEQTLLLLDEIGWELEPDLLIIGNLWSDSGERFFSDREWLAELNGSKFRLQWALRQSQLWRWVNHRVAPPEYESLPVGWVRDPYATGRRRVPAVDYGENLDHMLLQAAARGTSVVMLSPCNRFKATPENQDEETMWDAHFTTQAHVASRRGVPLVEGCSQLLPRRLNGDSAFLDEMHPTALVNGLYADAIVDALLTRGWPFKAVVPDAEPPLWDIVVPYSDIGKSSPSDNVRARKPNTR